MAGRSIRIFLPDGSPSGLRVAELGLSTIKCVVAPRTMLVDLAAREEAKKTGIYFLTGPDPEVGSRKAVYVGEGDTVLTRLKEHNKDDAKAFWDTAYIFVSKDQGLTKAHVRWLEAQSVGALRDAKRAKVMNGSNPLGGTLPEGDLAEMGEFLKQIQLLLPALGFSGFEPVSGEAGLETSVSDAVEFEFSGNGYSAVGHLSEGNFMVRKDSRARIKEVPTLPDSSKAVRASLLEAKVLVEDDDSYLLGQDYSFNSPSQAAEVFCGFPINGRMAWKTGDGRSLGEWQDAALESEGSGDS